MKNWRVDLRIGWRTEWEDKISQHIAGQIRAAREEVGLSQRQLSQIMGRSNAYISQVENGRLSPTVLDLIGFTFALNKPIRYFLPIEEKESEEPTGDELDLLEKFRKIQDDAIRQAAIRQVSELTKLTKAKSK